MTSTILVADDSNNLQSMNLLLWVDEYQMYRAKNDSLALAAVREQQSSDPTLLSTLRNRSYNDFSTNKNQLLKIK